MKTENYFVWKWFILKYECDLASICGTQNLFRLRLVWRIFWEYSWSHHLFLLLQYQLYRKGIKVTIVCPGPIKTATSSESSSSQEKGSSEVKPRSIMLINYGRCSTFSSDYGILYDTYIATLLLSRFLRFWHLTEGEE